MYVETDHNTVLYIQTEQIQLYLYVETTISGVLYIHTYCTKPPATQISARKPLTTAAHSSGRS